MIDFRSARETRASAFILGALPPVFAALASIVGRGYLAALFTDPLGRMLGIVACAFWIAGILWIRRLTRIEG